MTNDPLTRKLARSAAGLAPEDETFEQAANTSRLRQDPDYLERWVRHEESRKVPRNQPTAETLLRFAELQTAEIERGGRYGL